jgi:hypothetical protein
MHETPPEPRGQCSWQRFQDHEHCRRRAGGWHRPHPPPDTSPSLVRGRPRPSPNDTRRFAGCDVGRIMRRRIRHQQMVVPAEMRAGLPVRAVSVRQHPTPTSFLRGWLMNAAGVTMLRDRRNRGRSSDRPPQAVRLDMNPNPSHPSRHAQRNWRKRPALPS